MRRICSALLALALILCLLTACGPNAALPTQSNTTAPGNVTDDPMNTAHETTPHPTGSEEIPTNGGTVQKSDPPETGNPEPGPSPTITESPEPEPEPSPTVTESPEPEPEPSPSGTETPEPEPEPSPTVSESPKPEPEPSPSATESPEPEPEPSPAVSESPEPPASEDPYIDSQPVTSGSISEEADALIDSPVAIPDLLLAEASGVLVKENSKAMIDYSNTEDGYVMVKYTAETDKRLKVIVKGPTTQYTYNLTPGQWTVFPLSDGNGSYKVGVYQSAGDKYASVLSLSCEVTLDDEFAPFVRPNQYVNYGEDSTAVAMAARLTQGISDPLKKVEAVYDYVVQTLVYDKEKAASVKSGYLPDLDQVMEEKKGICFDYAALMAAMLRSQSIPCKLVVGYAGSAYHAWISVWTEEYGWVDGVIYFDGHAWHRMDPTFASSANQSEEIMKYIGDGSNYTVKYLY